MEKDADQKFEVGDRVKFVLPNGKIEEGTIRAVIPSAKGQMLNIAFGVKGDLSASANARQVVGKLPPVN